MSIVGISMVKNESDIIEACIRHNLTYLDALAVIDNDSTDGTREILTALLREGLPIVVFDDPIFGYFQSEKTTYVFRKVIAAFAPDYVLFLDADEFLLAPPRPELESRLEVIKAGTVGQIPWRTYVPSPAEGQSPITDPLRQITHRRANEQPPYFKAVIATVQVPCTSLIIAQGNHEIFTDEGQKLPYIDVPDVALGHFPVRSLDQLTSKVVTGWLAYLDRNRMKNVPGEGYQWQRLYERVVYGAGVKEKDVTIEALNYAQPPETWTWAKDVVDDPVRPNYDALKYGALGQDGAVARIARTVERVLLPNRRLRLALPARPLYVDLPPLRYLAERFAPQAVLDLGCGIGGYLKMFAEAGAESVLGVDAGPPDSSFAVPGRYRQHDLGKPLDLGDRFDLVLCLELASQFAPAEAATLLDTAIRHAKHRIVFSAAEPGQPGRQNVNCRPLADWLETFCRQGWTPRLQDTLAARSVATFPWFRRNLVVLGPREDGVSMAAIAVLVARAQQPVLWTEQAPVVVRHPLWELSEAG